MSVIEIPVGTGAYARKTLANAHRGAADRQRTKHDAKPHPATSDAVYSDEETVYLAAVEAYKARTNRKFPTHTEHLQVLKSLGYRQPGPDSPAV